MPLRTRIDHDRQTERAPDRPRVGALEHPNIDRPGAQPHPSMGRRDAGRARARQRSGAG